MCLNARAGCEDVCEIGTDETIDKLGDRSGRRVLMLGADCIRLPRTRTIRDRLECRQLNLSRTVVFEQREWRGAKKSPDPRDFARNPPTLGYGPAPGRWWGGVLTAPFRELVGAEGLALMYTRRDSRVEILTWDFLTP